MIITAEQAEQLNAVDAYAITSYSRVNGRLDTTEQKVSQWEGLTLEIYVGLSGFGEAHGSCVPTWQAGASADTIEEALTRALTYAPAQRDLANARSRGTLHELLPEYDPDGTRFAKRKPKASGPKLSLNELTALLDI